MIINIRGTSGSGKTTLMRKVLSWYAHKEPVFIDGRKQPLYYKCWFDSEKTWSRDPDLIVIGHYEAACGGCDTITNLDLAFQLVFEAAGMAEHVAFEGLLLSGDVKRCTELHDTFGQDFQVIALNTPLDVCISSVNSRRWAKDPTKDGVKPKNTESKYKCVLASIPKLQEAGVFVEHLSRGDAEERLMQILLGA
jgi:hypothetical protein